MNTRQSVALVTGGSRGIGLATAQRLARRGWQVVIAARDPAELETAGGVIRASGAATGGDCAVEPVDLSIAGEPTRLVHAVLSRFGRLDLLVNNAGYAPLAPLEQTTDDQHARCLAVNITAVFETVRAAWPAMRGQGGGVIVNVSSQASRDPFTGFSIYGASKAWVNLFTKAVAAEGRAAKIRVYAVAPGAVETRMLRENFPRYPAEQTLAPDEVAERIERCLDDPPPAPSGETLFIAKQQH